MVVILDFADIIKKNAKYVIYADCKAFKKSIEHSVDGLPHSFIVFTWDPQI